MEKERNGLSGSQRLLAAGALTLSGFVMIGVGKIQGGIDSWFENLEKERVAACATQFGAIANKLKAQGLNATARRSEHGDARCDIVIEGQAGEQPLVLTGYPVQRNPSPNTP